MCSVADVNDSMQPSPCCTAVLSLLLPTPEFASAPLLPWWLKLQPSAGHLLLPCPSCLVTSHVPSVFKTAAHVPCALCSTPRMGGMWSIQAGMEHRVGKGAQWSTNQRPRGPQRSSLWDPISMQPLRSVCVSAPAAQNPGRQNYFQPSCSEICQRWPQ